LFPVEERHPAGVLVADVATLARAGRNVLVFQPGKAEIQGVTSALQAMNLDAEIVPLHGDLEPAEQARAFRHYSRSKIVVATNVAQTSITIDDIDAVVDSGTEKRIEVVDGVEGLYLRPISLADSRQRKGRAGRCKAGIYIDYCPAAQRSEFVTAEILRVRLDMAVLRLKMAGIDMEELDLFHQPPRDQIREARRALAALGCMDAQGNVTDVGKQVSRLPLSANVGRMVVQAVQLGVVGDVITAAAILEVGGIVDRKNHEWRKLTGGEQQSDLLAQLAVFKAAKDMRGEDFRQNGVFAKAYFRAKEVAQRIRQNLDRSVSFDSTGNRLDILKAICAGMVDHLYRYSCGGMVNGDDNRELAQESIVRFSGSDFWAVGVPFDLQIQVRRRSMTLRLVQMVSRVDLAWLIEVAPQLVVQSRGLNPRYDSAKDLVVSTTEVSFNGCLVREEVTEDGEHPEAAKIFATCLASRMV
jgi:HrpA-like RNA helicase